MLGLCWVIWGFAGGFRAEKKKKRKIFGWVFFGVGFGLMPGHLDAMLGLCWTILGLCWAFVGSFGAVLAALGPKISTPTEAWFS